MTADCSPEVYTRYERIKSCEIERKLHDYNCALANLMYSPGFINKKKRCLDAALKEYHLTLNKSYFIERFKE